MKKTFRLTALILALLMLVNISASATTDGIPMENLKMADWSSMLQTATLAAHKADKTVEEYWLFISEETPVHPSAHAAASNATIPENTWVTGYGMENEMHKVQYLGETGYIQGSGVYACTCENASITDPATHIGTCAYYTYFMNLAINESADALLARWAFLTSSEQAFVLDYLKANMPDKYAAVSKLENVNKTEQNITSNGGDENAPSVNAAIKVPEGAFAEDYIMNAAPVALDQVETAITDALAGMHQLAVFDISFESLANGGKLQPNGAVELTFTIDTADVIGSTLLVHHMKDNGDGTYTAQLLNTVAVDKSLSAQTFTAECSSFSPIVVSADCKGSLANGGCGFAEFAALQSGFEREEWLLALLNQPEVDFDTQLNAFVLCASLNHKDIADINELVCLCVDEQFKPSLHGYGSLDHDDECQDFDGNIVPCPWSFPEIPVEDQLQVVASLTSTELQKYAESFYTELMATETKEEYEAVTAKYTTEVATKLLSGLTEEQSIALHEHYVTLSFVNSVVLETEFMNENNVTLALNAPVGTFPEGTNVSITDSTEVAKAFVPEYEELVAAFDISFLLETLGISKKIQPTNDVELQLTIPSTNLTYLTNTGLFVYHLKENADGTYTCEPVGEEVVVNPEIEEQTIVLQAKEFSTYFVTVGTTTATDRLSNGGSHTIYITPGGNATFSVQNGRQDVNIEWEPENFPGTYLKSTSGNNNNRVTTWTVSNIPETAIGETYVATITWDSSRGGSNTAHVTIHIMSEEEMQEQAGNIQKQTVLDKFDNTSYPVYLAIRQNGEIPNEPSIQSSASYSFFNSNYSTGSYVQFASCADGLVSADIVSHELFYFKPYYEGEEVVGLVNGTGEVIVDMIPGIDWERLLSAAAANGNIKATDGKTLTTQNMSDYKVVPYVVKLEEGSGKGWHIDCAIVPKEYVQLTYIFNLPTGVTINAGQTLGLPNQQTGPAPSTFDISSISGLKTITSDGTTYQNAMNVTYDGEGYVFYFMGWNTEPDGTGDWYFPNGWTYDNLTAEQKALISREEFKTAISIDVDTNIYAIWNSNPAIGKGNLLIRKVLRDDSGEVDVNQEYTFTVSISNASANESYKYTTYAANGVSISNGTVTNGGTVTLLAGQYIVIFDVPAVNDENGDPNITVTENVVSDKFAVQWSNQSAAGASTKVKIEGGRRSEVTCTNIVEASMGTLTITKNVNDETFTTGTFNFTVTPPEGVELPALSVAGVAVADNVASVALNITSGNTASVTLPDLPAGDYTVQETGAINYNTTVAVGTATAANGTSASVSVPAGETATVTFNNTRKLGNLKVCKVVEGVYAPDNSFTIAVTLNGAGNNTYAYKVYNADGTEANVNGTIGSSLNTVTLKNGQYALIEGIPQGATYKAEETNVDSIFSVSYTGQEGTISETAVAEAVVTNTHQVGSLTITKTVDKTTDDYFVFQIKQGTTEIMKVYIQGGGSTTISNLPAGNYTVTELESAWRYTSADDETVTVETGKTASVSFHNVHETDQWLDDEVLKDNKYN